MSERISKSNQNEEMTSAETQMTAGRSLTPPAFSLTAGSSNPQTTDGNHPIQAKADETETDEGQAMFEATQLLKFLDHLDVVIDLKDALTPSLLGTIKKVLQIRKFVDSVSDARKGVALSPEDAVGSVGKGTAKAVGSGIGFTFKAIDLTYWASVKGAKLVARGIWATQEFAGQISGEQYENAVDNLDDSVPESLFGLALMTTKTYRDLQKIKRLAKTIMDEFSALKILKRSLQNGDATMSDVFSTITDLKAYLADFLELCEQVESVLGDLGFDVDLTPVRTAIDKLSYPLKTMKQLIGETQPKSKGENEDAGDGGWSNMAKSLEPGYKPLLDSLGF